MIGKISMGSGAVGAIIYCYYDGKKTSDNGEKVIRGELLFSNELWQAKLANGHLDVKNMGAQFQKIATLNTNTQKFIWHQTFNFPPGEKVSSETMIKIARDFARDFGFENNQYLVFRHRDKPHEHFHIIANRINASGQNTATDKHNFDRIQQFCRKIEKKYELTVTDNPRYKPEPGNRKTNTQAERIRQLIDSALPYCKTLSELSIALKKKGIIIHLGRGISFTNQKYGITCKGSDLGKVYSRREIEKRLIIKPSYIPQTLQALDGSNKSQALIKNISSSPLTAGPNNASETRQDLLKISQSLQSVDPKNRRKRKMNCK